MASRPTVFRLRCPVFDRRLPGITLDVECFGCRQFPDAFFLGTGAAENHFVFSYSLIMLKSRLIGLPRATTFS